MSDQFPIFAPDTTVSARKTFNVDFDMEVPAFSQSSEFVPAIDEAYLFDGPTTQAILAGFAFNRRVMIQGYHGTGKSTHIEQVAARLPRCDVRYSARTRGARPPHLTRPK